MFTLLNFGGIARILGVLLGLLSFFQLLTGIVSWVWDSPSMHCLFISAAITLIAGTFLWLLSRNSKKQLTKRDGYLSVTLGWILIAIASTLPYLISGTIPGFTNAFFESISGLTTTGASILDDIEKLPAGILLWRSLTQWLGGMGIIVLTVALFPLLGMGGFELFTAEAPGPTSEKISPRINDTAKIFWIIYCCLTAFLALLYYVLGMTSFDAINHALTTMATGGFSTKNSSMINMAPSIQYLCTLFMFLAGCNYAVLYFGLRGKFKKLFYSDEFKTYLLLCIISILVITFRVFLSSDLGLEESFRAVSFQIVSLVTTTGFVSADYTGWTPGLTTFFFLLLFLGACAGSTSGGIKIIRHLIFFRNTLLEFKRILHPRGVIRIKVNKELVAPKIITHILVFLLIYMGIFAIGTLIVTACGLDLVTAVGAVATSLGNVGPGIGDVGPMDNFSWIPSHIKWILTLFMLIGRLELFSVLILFAPYFWRTQ